MLAVVACTLAEPLPGGHGWHHGGHGGHGHGGGGKGHGGHGGGGKGHGGHGHGGHGGGKGHGGHGGGGKGHGGHGGHGWWSICGPDLSFLHKLSFVNHLIFEIKEKRVSNSEFYLNLNKFRINVCIALILHRYVYFGHDNKF